MTKKICTILLTIISLSGCSTDSISYFNQEPPSNTPQLFAPSLVNTDSIELNIVFNSTNTEMFFSRIVNGSFIIHHTELINGIWSDIEPIQMYPDSISISVACDPTITQDGKTMYFLGVDPNNYTSNVTTDELYTIPPDIYRSEKVNGKWQLATKLEFGISTEHLESYPVVVANGSLYFQSNRPSTNGGRNTYRAEYLGDGKFSAPVYVSVATEGRELISYVSPNERYTITNGNNKFQIAYKQNGEWLAPIEVPLAYEKGWNYYCPYMTPDEKYFIFSRRYNNPLKKGWAGVEKSEVYWVSAGVVFASKKD